jgi:hypothetical protein
VEVAVSVPVHIAERVSEALGALYRHPDQTLLAWYRYTIYHALLAERSPAGYAVRAWIDVLSVQHVLFCWQPYARTDWHVTWLQPNDLLGLAEQTLRGTVDKVAVQRQITRAEALADVIGEDANSAHYAAWCVFEAALRALQSAWLYLAYCTTPAPSNSSTADGLELDDASSYAAIAIAGSLVPSHSDPRMLTAHTNKGISRETSEMQLRQTFFWEWWLREAIPQAWQRRYE